MAKTTTRSKKSKKEPAVDKEALRQQQRQAVLSLVEAMHREKNISKDIIFGGIDQAIQPEYLGRISAQAARQVMTQKIREAESEGVFTEFTARKGELVTATVQRVDN